MICPICKKEVTDKKYQPFCCKRCADVDLGNWFNESYRFEATEINEQDIVELEKALNEGQSQED